MLADDYIGVGIAISCADAGSGVVLSHDSGSLWSFNSFEYFLLSSGCRCFQRVARKRAFTGLSSVEVPVNCIADAEVLQSSRTFKPFQGMVEAPELAADVSYFHDLAPKAKASLPALWSDSSAPDFQC